MLKALWNQLYDKVKVVVLTGLVALGLAVLDVFAGVDWTSIVGGPWSAVIALGVGAVVAYARKELSGIFQSHVDPVDELPADTTEPPPVG